MLRLMAAPRASSSGDSFAWRVSARDRSPSPRHSRHILLGESDAMYLDFHVGPPTPKGGTRQVMVLAQEEARMLNHNYIGTEHLLLGLIHEGGGVAARALESLGISLQAVRQQVEEIIGQGQYGTAGRIPFTPRAKKVLELSRREALAMGHNYVGTEHILLGLLREGDGVAAQVLVRMGA